MFDIGASELLLVVIVAVVVIGPKDLPLALRTAGKWMAKIRRVSSHFRAGLDAMVREAELEELEREWKERNESIMKAHPDSALRRAVQRSVHQHDEAQPRAHAQFPFDISPMISSCRQLMNLSDHLFHRSVRSSSVAA